MGIKGIFAEGTKEFKRRGAVKKERKILKVKERVRGENLTALGKRAWKEKINISVAGELKEVLASIEKQQEELQTRQEELRLRKEKTEEKRKRENESFEAGCREVDQKKKGVEARLNAGKSVLEIAQKDREQISGRLARIPVEREQWHKKIAGTGLLDVEKTNIQRELENLENEERELKIRFQEKTAAINAQSEKVNPVQQEYDRLQKQIDEIRTGQKQVISQLDKALGEIVRDMHQCVGQQKEMDDRQQANFMAWGEKLAEVDVVDAAVATEMTTLRGTEKEMAEIHSRIDILEGQKTTVSADAYKKMMVIVIAGMALVAAIVIVLTTVL